MWGVVVSIRFDNSVDFVDEFAEASTTVAPSSASPTLDARSLYGENTVRLQQLIDRLHRNGGGILHFSPGRYYLGRRDAVPLAFPDETQEHADLVVYHDVVLWFAPGAQLVPLGAPFIDVRPELEGDAATKVRIEIQGAIRARRSAIFDCCMSMPSENINFNDPVNAVAGVVLFTGGQVEEIYPEWWGASSTSTQPAYIVRGFLALQAAFDAAHRHRQRVVRDDRQMVVWAHGEPLLRAQSAIPIALLGRYYVYERELMLGRPKGTEDPLDPANTAPFELRGERGVSLGGDKFSSLVRHLNGTSNAPGAVLAIRGVSGFSINHVAVHGNLIAETCVLIETAPGPGVRSNFDGCSFLEGKTLVRIVSRDGIAPPEVMSFQRCRFDTGGEFAVFTAGLVYPEKRLIGVDLDVKDRCLVEFHSCFMSGPASPFIMARSGWFSMQETTMHSIRLWDNRPVEQINAELNSPNGTDVLIEQPTFALTPLRVSDFLSEDLTEPASFTAKEFESQSWQVIASYEEAVRNPTRTSTIIVNANMNIQATPPGLTHREDGVDPRNEAWRQLWTPPAICWRGPRTQGGDLILAGIVTRAWVHDPIPSGMVAGVEIRRDMGRHPGYIHVGPATSPQMTGRVFDLGTHTRNYYPTADPHLMGTTMTLDESFGSNESVGQITLQVVPTF